MLRARNLAFLGAAALAVPGSALAAQRDISISGNAFQPRTTLALPGDTVVWRNNDFAFHNVTFEDVASPTLARGDRYERSFAAADSFGYRCTLHSGMTGSVSVSDLHFFAPTTPVLFGSRALFTGLAPAGATVEIQRMTASGAETVGTTTAAGDGKYQAALAARLPGRYQAATAGKTSALRSLKVRPRVSLAARRSGRTAFVTVSTTPAQAGAPILLQRRTASGWARVGSARLNARSKATFRLVVRGTTRVRAKLTRGVRGYSPSTSRILTLR